MLFHRPSVRAKNIMLSMAYGLQAMGNRGVRNRSIDYFRNRERVEREAAKNASCDAARWAHQEMAASYARMLSAAEREAE